MSTQTMSKIRLDAVENLQAVFAGQTVTFEQIMAQIDFVYMAAGKFRNSPWTLTNTVGAFYPIMDELKRRGVTGCIADSYTFPVA